MRVVPWRWIREQLGFLLVLAVLGAAFIYLLVEPADWRPATEVIAASMLLAGVIRIVVPSAHVGLLVVRARWIDSVCYLLIGALILVVDIRLRQ